MNLLPFGPFLFSISLSLFGLPLPGLAQAAGPAGWRVQSWAQAMGYAAFFATVGLLLAFAAYKLFDQCAPEEPPPVAQRK